MYTCRKLVTCIAQTPVSILVGGMHPKGRGITRRLAPLAEIKESKQEAVAPAKASVNFRQHLSFSVLFTACY